MRRSSRLRFFEKLMKRALIGYVRGVGLAAITSAARLGVMGSVAAVG